MFANDYQGGAHVEVLGTQGQNPLAQWKVSGPQKGVQKVYDKVLKGYVFVSSGACRLALPKDDRSALGLVQPHLLLQLEVGVGTPFSVEVGLSDASATRRRIILSSSFSELKCTPLHCQVPFTCLPRESWLNLVLPVADLAAVLFKAGGGGNGASGASGLSAAALSSAAAGGGSFSPGTAAAAGAAGAGAANLAYRTLDSLQLAGTCRLRRICTLRDAPQPTELQELGTNNNNMASSSSSSSAKSLEFPAGVEFQTLILDPRSLSLVGLHGGGSGSPNQTMTPGASGAAAGSGLGVVGTSTGSSRRPANGGTAPPLSGFGNRSSPNGPSKGGSGPGGGAAPAGVAAVAAAGPGGAALEDDSATGGTQQVAPLMSAVPHHIGDTPTRGSSSGTSTPTARGSSAVPTLPPAFGAAPGQGHHGLGNAEHSSTLSRLGRSPSGYFNGLGNGTASPTQQHQPGPASGAGSGPGSSSGSGPLPNMDSASSLSGMAAAGGGGGGGGGHAMKLPRLHANGANAAAAAAAAASSSGVAGGGPTSPTTDDPNRGDDTSPFGSRRALSAQTPPRQSGSATPPGSAGGSGSGTGTAAPANGAGVTAGSNGVSGGKPPASPWSGSSSKRAQSGPARISTEALAQGLGDTMAPSETPTSPSLVPRQTRRTQNNSHIPPTISEHEVANPASGAGTPAVKSPVRSPSRIRSQPSNSASASAVTAGALSAAMNGTAMMPAPNCNGLRPSGGSGLIEPASPVLPQLRHIRAEAAAAAAAAASSREQPASPGVVALGASSANPFAQLSSVLTIRGGMDASIDFGSHSHLADGSPGASAILSSNLRISSVTGHTHRYGGATGAAAADTLSNTDADGVASPSGTAAAAGASGGSAGTATCPATAAASDPPVSVKVPRIRTRVLPGGGSGAANGNGNGSSAPGRVAAPNAVGPDGASNSRSPSMSAAVPSSPALNTRKGSGHASDVDSPTPAGRGFLSSAISQNGRNSPANTPGRIGGGGGGGGRITPLPSGGGGGGVSTGLSGAGPSNLGPGNNNNGGRPRKEDVSVNGRSSGVVATSAVSSNASASGGGGGGGAGVVNGKTAGPSSGAGGVSAGPKPSGGAAGAVCSSPVRQRAVASGSAARGGTTKPIGGGGTSTTPPDNRERERLPPLAMLAAGRGRSNGANPGRGVSSGGGGGGGGGNGRGNPAAGRGLRNRRPTTSNEVDVEESITLNAGLWGGFGVDEDDDMLGSRHFRNCTCGSSESDAELGGGGGGGNAVQSSGPSLHNCGGRGSGRASCLVQKASGSSSPDLLGGGVGMTEELPSPPDHYGNATNNGLQSPPIRRTSNTAAAVAVLQDAFAGLPAPMDRRRSSAAGSYRHGGAASGDEDRPSPSRHVLDSLLDEEALLAGLPRDLDHYDDWSKVDQRPTPPDILHAHRIFTPPVVPASKSLGVSIHQGRSSGGRGMKDGGDTQMLRVSAAAAAAAGRSGDRGKGVVAAGGGEAMLDLVYDPILNCYYDGTTGQYYELKT